MNEAETWQKFHDVAKKAIWAYLATTVGAQPKVRVVHPGFEGQRLWIATGRTSPVIRSRRQTPVKPAKYPSNAT